MPRLVWASALAGVAIGAAALVPFDDAKASSGGCYFYMPHLIAPRCLVVASDSSGRADPKPIWGSIDCARNSRVRRIASGGDFHVTALGNRPPNTDYRQLTVRDGDNVWGERCELGRN